MLGLLRRPRWLGYLTLALVFAVVAASLGVWQWGRYEEKAERRDQVEANYEQDPVQLEQVRHRLEPELDPQDTWLRVSATGEYAAQHQHLVRNRPHQRTFGYEVLVPLVLADGSALTVNRGWVPNAPAASELPAVPPSPDGQVTVTGWLRASERDLGRDLPDGQLASIDLPGLAQASGLDLIGAYLVLDQENPAVERPEAALAPDTRLGSHLAYALQWWLTVPAGVILVLVMARRTAREEADAQAVAAGHAPRQDKPKKVRIWDEEDE